MKTPFISILKRHLNFGGQVPLSKEFSPPAEEFWNFQEMGSLYFSSSFGKDEKCLNRFLWKAAAVLLTFLFLAALLVVSFSHFKKLEKKKS